MKNNIIQSKSEEYSGKATGVGAGIARPSRNDQTGITLIALIITIIVLLILAGVTINLTLGENGIFTTAQQAAKNYTEAENKELGEIDSFYNEIKDVIAGGAELPENTPTTPSGTQVKKPAGKTWDETKINSYADGAGNTIPVPVGFTPITVAEGQGTKLTGFVIRNNSDRNEFVWVPVEGMGYTYNRYDFGKQSGSYSNYSETMPSDEQISVTIYGGYYIGRYEAGIEGGTLSSNTNSSNNTDWTGYTGGNLVVQSGKQVWNYITRNRAVTEATGLYNKENNNVASKLCSSYAWDTALKFIESQNSTYPTNSTGGYYGKSSPTTTGYDITHPCNIYDMGGNVWECTTESCSTAGFPCSLRGGGYDRSATDIPASYRTYNSETRAYDDLGFRVTLYI